MDIMQEALSRAETLEQEGELEEALSVYHDVLAQNPECLTALTAIPLLQHRLGLLDAARDSYRRFLDRQPLAYDYVENISTLLMQIGDVEGSWTAVIDYCNTGGADPRAAQTAAYLAETAGRADIARYVVSLIMNKIPGHPVVLKAAAEIAGFEGDHESAVRFAGLAGKIGPDQQFISRRVNIPGY